MSTQKIAFQLVLFFRKSLMARALSISFELKAKSEIDPTKEDSEGERERHCYRLIDNF